MVRDLAEQKSDKICRVGKGVGFIRQHRGELLIERAVVDGWQLFAHPGSL